MTNRKGRRARKNNQNDSNTIPNHDGLVLSPATQASVSSNLVFMVYFFTGLTFVSEKEQHESYNIQSFLVDIIFFLFFHFTFQYCLFIYILFSWYLDYSTFIFKKPRVIRRNNVIACLYPLLTFLDSL